MVEGAAAGAAGASGTTRPGTGWSMGGMAGPALPPKIALSMEGLAGAVVRAGRDIRAAAEVETPRDAARSALERTMATRVLRDASRAEGTSLAARRARGYSPFRGRWLAFRSLLDQSESTSVDLRLTVCLCVSTRGKKICRSQRSFGFGTPKEGNKPDRRAIEGRPPVGNGKKSAGRSR